MIFVTFPIIAFILLSGLAFLSFRFASIHRNEGESLEPARRGCLLALGRLLLRPIPIVLAFYQFGFLIAVLVALVMWLISHCIDLIKNGFISNLQLIQIILPLGAALTLFTGDLIYFQLIPSAWCVVHVVEQLFGLRSGQTNLLPGGENNLVFSVEETKMARWGILGASLTALPISEYARQKLSSAGWIWYYAYLRLELLPIILGAIMPALIKMIGGSESEQHSL